MPLQCSCGCRTLCLVFAGLLALAMRPAIASSGEVGRAEIAAARPGQVLRVEPLVGGGPDGSKAVRILYRSTSMNGRPIATSAALFYPSADGARQGRPIVAWAHPTTGVGDHCAPTQRPDMAGSVPGLDLLLARGFVVVATDYEGLGTPGDHPYLVGDSAARSVIDSVRAARSLTATGAGRRFVVWGHSQGGHAALFVGERARALAPELELVGVAAAAPATDLVRLLELERDTDTGRNIVAYTLHSWSRVYGADLSRIVAPGAGAALRRLAGDCLQSIGDYLAVLQDLAPLRQRFLTADPDRVEPWRSLMRRNSPGSAIRVPVLLAQGTADRTVPVTVTRDYARRLCRRGTAVRWLPLDGGSHILAARSSAAETVAWLAGRFAGERPRSDCGALR